MLSIKEARDRYNKPKSNGGKVGMSAFTHYAEKDLLILARKLANQSNRQYKRMLSYNYKTPAVLGYFNVNANMNNVYDLKPSEIYDKGKISINKNMNKSQLLDNISHSLYFMNTKTHTVPGYMKALDLAKATLKEHTGVDLSSLTMQETTDFWNRYNQLLADGKQFAVENNSLGSPDTMKRINKYKEKHNVDTLLEAMEKMSNDMEDGTYDDFYDEPNTDNDEGQTESVWFS